MLRRNPPLLSAAEADAYAQRHYRWNVLVNLLDGTLFSLGLSFASTVAVLPLFIRHLTDAPLAVGLIPAIAGAGWLLPQLLTARHVERLPRSKPFVLLASGMERFQWWLLAPMVLAVDRIGRPTLLTLFYVLFIWWVLGGGFAGTAWQHMIAKIMPPQRRGLFFGVQSTLGGLAGAGGAVAASAIVQRWPFPANFALCFALAGVCFVLSYGFLALTREPAVSGLAPDGAISEYVRRLGLIVRANPNYGRFLLGRSAIALSSMPLGFITLYAVARFGAAAETIGSLAATLFVAQAAGNILCGVAGDRRGYIWILMGTALAAGVAWGIALAAPTLLWLYLTFALVGLVLAGTTVAGTTIVFDFAPPSECPTYIGLTATLLAVPTGLAPLIGSWIVGALSYSALFAVAGGCACAGFALLRWGVVDPRTSMAAADTTAVSAMAQ
jgi:MFS family permease